jgi:[ribosomal protein S5]-alanine N-acetyltransferase
MSEMPSRVELRPLTLSDQDEFCSLVQASTELHRPWMQLPATAEQFQAWIRRFDDGINLGFLIRVRETGAAAGAVNINSIIQGRYQGASLGYAAFGPSAGQGYMTDGLSLILQHAFSDLRLHRLEANIQPANTASLALAKRLGFRYEGLCPPTSTSTGHGATTNAGPSPHPTPGSPIPPCQRYEPHGSITVLAPSTCGNCPDLHELHDLEGTSEIQRMIISRAVTAAVIPLRPYLIPPARAQR